MRYFKRKGYLVERKVRMLLHQYGWVTVRSGGSLGFADLVCLKKGKCILMQVKSTRKPVLYTEKIPLEVQGFPLYVVVDFGYWNIRVFKPGERMSSQKGTPLKEFLKKILKKL